MTVEAKCNLLALSAEAQEKALENTAEFFHKLWLEHDYELAEFRRVLNVFGSAVGAHINSHHLNDPKPYLNYQVYDWTLFEPEGFEARQMLVDSQSELLYEADHLGHYLIGVAVTEALQHYVYVEQGEQGLEKPMDSLMTILSDLWDEVRKHRATITELVRRAYAHELLFSESGELLETSLTPKDERFAIDYGNYPVMA